MNCYDSNVELILKKCPGTSPLFWLKGFGNASIGCFWTCDELAHHYQRCTIARSLLDFQNGYDNIARYVLVPSILSNFFLFFDVTTTTNTYWFDFFFFAHYQLDSNLSRTFVLDFFLLSNQYVFSLRISFDSWNFYECGRANRLRVIFLFGLTLDRFLAVCLTSVFSKLNSRKYFLFLFLFRY